MRGMFKKSLAYLGRLSLVWHGAEVRPWRMENCPTQKKAKIKVVIMVSIPTYYQS
jgi:hypothetical protein